MRVYVLTKLPVPGRVKTRLQGVLGRKRTAFLHRCLLARTLAVARQAGVGRVTLAVTPSRASHAMRQTGLRICVQRGDDLGRRMHNLTGRGRGPAMLLGADCPGLRSKDIVLAAQWLEQGADCVLGPALDGGYWLIGLRHPEPALFRCMRWGHDSVLAETRRRLRRRGLTWRELTPRPDLDRPRDLAILRLECPGWLR